MTDLTLFVGLDVHKKTISVALVEGAAGAAVRFYGTIANTPELGADPLQETVAGRAAALFLLRGGAMRVWRAASTDAGWGTAATWWRRR